MFRSKGWRKVGAAFAFLALLLTAVDWAGTGYALATVFDGLPAAEQASGASANGSATDAAGNPGGTAGDGTVRTEAARSGGGAYRSPGGSFGGGARTGVSPGGGTGYRTGPRTPSPNVTRPPSTTAPGNAGGGFFGGRAGSFFGGLAAGAVLGHLFNPFAGFAGAGYGGFGGIGMSLISLLLWAGILYVAYRLIRRMFGGRRGGGGDGRNGRGGWYR